MYYLFILYRFVHGVKKKPHILCNFNAFFSARPVCAPCRPLQNRL